MIKQEAGRNNNSTLLLITDGVRGLRLENELWPIPVNLCNAIKNDGIKLLVVELEYPYSPNQQDFNNYVRPFYNDITPNLKACASEGMYYKVKFGDNIIPVFDKLVSQTKAEILRIVK
jgi:hypothetical protein